MPNFRDAETGEYISQEEAESRDPSTWVKEEDSGERRFELREIYRRCKANSITPSGSHVLNQTATLPLETLKRILNDYGAKIKD